MKKNGSFPYLAIFLIVVLCLASAPLMGAPDAVEVLDPADIVNIAGRGDLSTNNKVIYTVPSGKTLVLQGVTVNAASIAGIFPAPVTLKCGADILIPQEVMSTFFGEVFIGGELGLVCPADSQLRLVNGPVANADTVGWMLIGQLVTP